MAWTTEFKVGVFVLVAGGATAFFTMWSMDGKRPSDQVYFLHLSAPSADGLYRDSAVKIAGVPVGAIESITVSGGHADILLGVKAEAQLPTGTMADIRSSGMLGDRYVGLYPGDQPGFLKDGDYLQLKSEPPDLEQIERQVQDIAGDVKAITAAVRAVTTNKDNQERFESTLANIESLTDDLASLAKRNSGDVDAIVESIRRLSASLEGFATETRGGVKEEIEKVKGVTDKLDKAAADVASITGKVDRGEGTIGALLNDPQTINQLNDTIANVNTTIKSYSGLRAEVYYTNRFYIPIGTPPVEDDTGPLFVDGNPLGWSAANTIGIALRPQEDFFWNFEIVDYPNGSVDFTEHYYPETGERWTEWTQSTAVKITFQMNKRWRNLGLRLGVKESGGGLGMSYFFARDKVRIDADIFEFSSGAYPAIREGQAGGLPNTRLIFHYEPFQKLYFEAGFEQVALGMKYGYGTGFVGAGFRFDDDAIKLLLATLPIGR
jgi:phospholipid/cholesterol/gamma-HCH transport system substrate-binding protein